MSAVIEEAVDIADDINQKVNEFFEKVNDLLDWVPWPASELIDEVQEAMARLRQKVDEFWTKVEEFFTNTGNPDKLKEFADQWLNSIGNPVGEIADDIALDRMDTNIEWVGRAAEAYRVIVPPQAEGLNGIKDLAEDLSKSLKALADGIEDFWSALAWAFGIFLAGIVAAIAGAVTLVGIPAAVVALTATIATSINLIATAVQERDALEDTIATEQDGIRQGVHNLGDEWRKSKHSLGDPGDWQPR